jgi:hypothetical protein
MARRFIRVVLAALGAAAVLIGGAWVGGAFSRAEAATARAPRATDGQAYPRPADGEIPVGDSLVVNGQPMQLSLFVTEDKPAQVAEYYRKAFAERKLVPVTYANDQMGHVSVFDPEDGYQRFITAVPQPDGQTMVILGVTNPRRPPRLTQVANSMPFPVPDKQRGFLGYESVDGGTRAQNGQFAIAMPARAVLDWYRDALTKQGYVENGSASSGSIAVFDRPGASITVSAQALDDKTSAMVFVSRVEGGAR